MKSQKIGIRYFLWMNELSKSIVNFFIQKGKMSAGLVFLLPLSAFADDSDDKVQTVLQTLLTFVTGAWGMTICSLAVAGMGFACFVLGAVPLSRVIAVSIGSACVIGAPRLIQLFTGGTA